MADALFVAPADRVSSVRSRQEGEAPRGSEEPRGIGLPNAIVLLSIALVFAGALRAGLGGAWEGFALGPRAGLLLYDVGQHLGFALAVAAVVGAWQRWGPHSRAGGLFALASVSIAVGWVVLGPDLEGLAAKLWHLSRSEWLHPVLVVSGSLTVVLATLVGSWLGRPGWRWIPFSVSAAVLVGHAARDYPGIHLALVANSIALGATALATWRAAAPGWLVVIRPGLVTMASVVGAFALFVPAPHWLRVALTRSTASVAAPFVLPLWPAAGEGGSPQALGSASAWFARRDEARSVPPTKPQLIADDTMVVLLVADSLRADFLEARETRALLPNMTRLCAEGISFSRARAPGSATVESLTSLFSGLYFSQIYWQRHPLASAWFPHADPTARFTDLLTEARASTVSFPSARWLTSSWGVARGFSEERLVALSPRTGYSPSSAVVAQLVSRLRQSRQPLFAYAHLFDAHVTVRRKLQKGSDVERYMLGLQTIDAELGRLLAALEKDSLDQRVLLIFTSDHGEALGQHATPTHGATLYEELLRVPLCFWGEYLSPGVVKEPVSLIDIGPTVLDLMGVPTPGKFMGQSLVGMLRRDEQRLTRPIIAEGRLKTAMVFRDGIKAIVDDRWHTVEIYDLARDPWESHNLWDRASPELKSRVAALRAFFRTQTLRRPGYEIPHRR